MVGRGRLKLWSFAVRVRSRSGQRELLRDYAITRNRGGWIADVSDRNWPAWRLQRGYWERWDVWRSRVMKSDRSGYIWKGKWDESMWRSTKKKTMEYRWFMEVDLSIDNEREIIDGFWAHNKSSEVVGAVETIAIEDTYHVVADLFHRQSSDPSDATTVEDC